MSKTSGKKRRKNGQVVRIELGQDTHSYARVLDRPSFAFYDRAFGKDDRPDLNEILALPIAFTLWVMDYVFSEYRWPVIGWAELDPSLLRHPKFWKQDEDTDEISIYHRVPELGPLYERPANYEEAKYLECAAVWDPEHVEDRLRDHFAGRENKWVQSMKIRRPVLKRVSK